MKIQVEPGTIVRIGRKTLSTKGGVFDLPDLPPEREERLLAIDGVREVSGEEPDEPDPLTAREEIEIDATDAARDLAAGKIDLRTVDGTGENGRIVKADIEKLLQRED